MLFLSCSSTWTWSAQIRSSDSSAMMISRCPSASWTSFGINSDLATDNSRAQACTWFNNRYSHFFFFADVFCHDDRRFFPFGFNYGFLILYQIKPLDFFYRDDLAFRSSSLWCSFYFVFVTLLVFEYFELRLFLSRLCSPWLLQLYFLWNSSFFYCDGCMPIYCYYWKIVVFFLVFRYQIVLDVSSKAGSKTVIH